MEMLHLSISCVSLMVEGVFEGVSRG